MAENLDLLNQIYNLVLDRDIRDWERAQLLVAKQRLETGAAQKAVKAHLESTFRPLALRGTLTPKVLDFYQSLDGHQILGGTDQGGLRPALSSLASPDQDKAAVPLENQERAIFAGGCFWFTVEPFDTKPGVLSIVSGFTGGHVAQPTYDQVCTGTTGHVEAVEILFDNRIIRYQDLLDIYWGLINPLDGGGQFLDRGPQYRAMIFVANDRQRLAAEKSKADLQASGKYDGPIVVEIRQAADFWPAEPYHQDWYKYNPKRYKMMEAARARYYKDHLFSWMWRK